ncbi:MAG TPA: DUF1461 domain-containing protein [Candidatus Limnocylindria bacterium]
MTAANTVAARSGDRPSLLELALFSLALVVGGLVLAALAWSGTGPYEDMARASGVRSETFTSPSGQPVRLDLPQIVELHRAWSFYVTGGGDAPPEFTDVRFTEDEVSHMVDVRHVFDVAKLAIPTAIFIVIVRLQRARLRGSRAMWRLARDGSLVAFAVVALVGLAAALAFDQMFLLFHAIFFPQGNFLFDPATSDLVRLYPDWYWEGITLRVGASFLVAVLGLAAFAAARLRVAK